MTATPPTKENAVDVIVEGILVLRPVAARDVRADMVVVLGIRIEGEGYDLPDLTLPWGQDAVIDAVASANPNTPSPRCIEGRWFRSA